VSTFAKYSASGGGTVVQTISSNVVDVSGTTAIALSFKAPTLVVQSGGTATMDLSTSPAQHLVLTANCALTLTNPSQGGSYVLEIVQDSTPRTLTFASTVFWGPQGAPDMSTLSAGQWGIINIFYDRNNRFVGSYYLGYGP
jgi:hypothetical protein